MSRSLSNDELMCDINLALVEMYHIFLSIADKLLYLGLCCSFLARVVFKTPLTSVMVVVHSQITN